MAGLIGLQSSDIELQDALGLVKWELDDWIPHPVVRLTTTLPVAVNKEGVRTGVRARWGFPVGGGRPVGNARDDRLLESPMWSGMLGKTPCLVAATAVYEQAEVNGKKTSLWFRRIDGKPILMPGLCAPRKTDPASGEARLCCAIVTTAPNAFFGQYHDRQVCEVTRAEADQWMTGQPKEDAMRLLHAPRLEDWEAVPVDDQIFKPGRREDEHLQPIGDPLRWTGAAAPKRTARNATLM